MSPLLSSVRQVWKGILSLFYWHEPRRDRVFAAAARLGSNFSIVGPPSPRDCDRMGGGRRAPIPSDLCPKGLSVHPVPTLFFGCEVAA